VYQAMSLLVPRQDCKPNKCRDLKWLHFSSVSGSAFLWSASIVGPLSRGKRLYFFRSRRSRITPSSASTKLIRRGVFGFRCGSGCGGVGGGVRDLGFLGGRPIGPEDCSSFSRKSCSSSSVIPKERHASTMRERPYLRAFAIGTPHGAPHEKEGPRGGPAVGDRLSGISLAALQGILQEEGAERAERW